MNRPSRVVTALSRAGAPVAAVAGVRLALEPGRGRSAVPVRNTLAAATLAVGSLIAALTFGANLDRLISNPERYGKRWHVSVDGGYTMLPAEPIIARLRDDPTVVGFSGGTPGEVVVGGRQVPAMAIDRLEGDVFPTLLEGRPPATPDEIVLGTKVLRRLHRSVGDRVEVEIGGSTRPMRVVGRAVFPAVGMPGHGYTGLGEGAAVAGGVLPPVSPPDPNPANVYNFFLVRFRADAAREGQQRLEADTHRHSELGPPCETNAGACVMPQRPGDISNYARVRSTPLALAGLLLLLGLATLAHALVSFVHRRRRELAILRTLGFLRGQISGTVAWQATTIAVLTVVTGLPIGVLAGRWAWMVFADALGVQPDPTLPVTVLLVSVPAALALANLLALPPALAAGRTRPGALLRSE